MGGLVHWLPCRAALSTGAIWTLRRDAGAAQLQHGGGGARAAIQRVLLLPSFYSFQPCV